MNTYKKVKTSKVEISGDNPAYRFYITTISAILIGIAIFVIKDPDKLVMVVNAISAVMK